MAVTRKSNHGRQVLRWGILSTARINRRLDSGHALCSANRAGRSRQPQPGILPTPMPPSGRSPAPWAATGLCSMIPTSMPSMSRCRIASTPTGRYVAAQAGKHVLCEKAAGSVGRRLATASKPAADGGRCRRGRGDQCTSITRCSMRPAAWSAPVHWARWALPVALSPLSWSAPRMCAGSPSWAGGALWISASYPVSFCQWILGEPDRVFAWQTLAGSGVDAATRRGPAFSRRPMAAFDCSFRQAFRTQVEVAGNKGR